MYKKEEYFYLDSLQYYTENIIEPFTEIRVFLVNEEKVILEELEYVSYGNFLNEKSFSVYIDRGIILFSPENIGKLFKVEYYTSGEVNPFSISERLFFIIEELLRWSKLRIISGIYFYKEPHDREQILRLKGGEFIYRGDYYIMKEKIIDFSMLAAPTISGKFRGYMFYIDENTIDEHTNLYRPMKTIDEPSILYTSQLYDKTYHAKNELLEKYKKSFPNMDRIIIAYVFLRIDDNNYNFWIEYPSGYRMITRKVE